MKDIRLLSNSVSFGGKFMEHCEEGIFELLQGINEVLFIPYAKKDYDSYVEKAQIFFDKADIKLVPIHKNDPREAVDRSKAIFVPGGNTFRLLNELYSQKLVDLIREKVLNGVKYIGSSAGSAIAGPTIKTTNDMPIVEPPSFDALNLIPFQLNCHYLDKDPNFPHNGESREMRIMEFHEEAGTPVVGLREDTWLECKGDNVILRGKEGAVFFRKGKSREQIALNSRINL